MNVEDGAWENASLHDFNSSEILFPVKPFFWTATCSLIIENRELNYLRMNYRFEKITLSNCMNFR